MQGSYIGRVVTAVIVGVILGVGTTFVALSRKTAGLEERTTAQKETISVLEKRLQNLESELRRKPSGSHEATSTPIQEDLSLDANYLIEIVKDKQATHVKVSFGELAHQCFTDEDLEAFKRNRIPERIAQDLRKNNRFLSVVLAVKALPPVERQELLEAASKTAKPTWAELNRIDVEGQTEAGHIAEKMIASRIVDLVSELCRLSAEDIKKLYQ